MITSAEVWLRDGSTHIYECDNVVFDPLGAYLKLMVENDTSVLFAGGSWSHVVIVRK